MKGERESERDKKQCIYRNFVQVQVKMVFLYYIRRFLELRRNHNACCGAHIHTFTFIIKMKSKICGGKFVLVLGDINEDTTQCM